jgi:hypothetical protein
MKTKTVKIALAYLTTHMNVVALGLGYDPNMLQI